MLGITALTLTVNLAQATACVSGHLPSPLKAGGEYWQECTHVLVGKRTPAGEFQSVYASVHHPGYRGHVLAFHETETEMFSVHGLYEGTEKAKAFRQQAIKFKTPSARVVSNGCVNVPWAFFDQYAPKITKVVITK